MNRAPTFRLRKEGREVRLEAISDLRWRVVSATGNTGFQAGDEVTPVRRMSWREAARRVNGARTAVSPQRLVLLRGKGFERSEPEVEICLRTRPWDPDTPPTAA